MKKIRKMLMVIAALVLVSVGGSRLEIKAAELEEDANLIIEEIFPDPVFASYIAKQLKKNTDDVVTQEELNKIKVVSIIGKNLKSIEGLQYLNYVSDIRLYSNQISDLTPFASWSPQGSYNGWTVWHIWLADNPITDLKPLTHLKDISVLDLYIHAIPIDNSQIDNLKTLDENWYIGRYAFGRNHIDDFSRLQGTFVERLAGYNDISNQHHTIDLGSRIITSKDEEVTLENPALWFDGSVIPVTFAPGGIVSEDNKEVTWSNLYYLEDRPESLSFRAVKTKTDVTYNLNLLYAHQVVFDTDGGTVIATQEVLDKESVVEPEVPEKAGFSFVEWQLDGITYDFDTPLERDITLQAIYQAAEIIPVDVEESPLEPEVGVAGIMIPEVLVPYTGVNNLTLIISLGILGLGVVLLLVVFFWKRSKKN